jgi:actin-like ATPase involved in cell morphogenesis
MASIIETQESAEEMRTRLNALREETGLPVHIAEDPLSAGAVGTGKALQEIDFLRAVASADRARS